MKEVSKPRVTAIKLSKKTMAQTVGGAATTHVPAGIACEVKQIV